jgi:hypothetical protein
MCNIHYGCGHEKEYNEAYRLFPFSCHFGKNKTLLRIGTQQGYG